MAQVKKDAKLAYYEQPGPHIWWVTLNTEKKPFNDVRVRRAVNYAVNREAIAGDLLKKTATAAIGPVPPSITWAFTDQVTKYPYDPARAKKLLAEAGYPNGFPAVFWIPESGSGMQSPKTMAQAIQADLAAVGVQASIQTFEWGAYLNKYGKGFGQEADMGAMSFMLDPGDPAPMLSLVIDGKGGFRGGAYANPEVDKLLAEASRIVDLKKRGDLYRRCRSWWWTTPRGSSSTTRSRTRPAARRWPGSSSTRPSTSSSTRSRSPRRLARPGHAGSRVLREPAPGQDLLGNRVRLPAARPAHGGYSPISVPTIVRHSPCVIP